MHLGGVAAQHLSCEEPFLAVMTLIFISRFGLGVQGRPRFDFVPNLARLKMDKMNGKYLLTDPVDGFFWLDAKFITAFLILIGEEVSIVFV